jgi:hypothetical protein
MCAQTQAVISAAIKCALASGGDGVRPEIMIPLVCSDRWARGD